jgi:hypothetical protein
MTTAMIEAPATELKKLGSTIENTSHFTDSQEKTEQFQHVAKVWQKQCLTFDQGREKLANQQKQIVDIRGPLKDWKPIVTDEDKFGLLYQPTGQIFVPTVTAVKNMAAIGGTSEWFLNDMLNDKVKGEGDDREIIVKRDRRDAEAVVKVMQTTLFAFDRIDGDKQRLFRTWQDGTLRAMLSEQYAIVNNQWYMDVLARLIPGGLLSHWRGDADTIFGNVLIPDTIRVESDSHYGGMLSIGNSEIGVRRIMSLPSVFRAICMNGCIWGQEKGTGVNKVHRGEIDFIELEAMIADNLKAQIPLLDSGIVQLLALKKLSFGTVKTVQAVAQFFIDNKLPKSLTPKFLAAYNEESELEDTRNAFGLQAALTRVGQKFDPDTWFKFDQIAGGMFDLTAPKWDAMLKRAESLNDKEMAKALGDISHLMA